MFDSPAHWCERTSGIVTPNAAMFDLFGFEDRALFRRSLGSLGFAVIDKQQQRPVELAWRLRPTVDRRNDRGVLRDRGARSIRSRSYALGRVTLAAPQEAS